jgi:hypothetical protein
VFCGALLNNGLRPDLFSSRFDLAGSFPGCSDATSAGSHPIANKVTLSGTIASGIGWQGRPESHPHGDPMK